MQREIRWEWRNQREWQKALQLVKGREHILNFRDNAVAVSNRARLTHQGVWTRVIAGFGEGNGTLLQYSCLENPMDGGAW